MIRYNATSVVLVVMLTVAAILAWYRRPQAGRHRANPLAQLDLGDRLNPTMGRSVRATILRARSTR
jgi:hypothetical protein